MFPIAGVVNSGRCAFRRVLLPALALFVALPISAHAQSFYVSLASGSIVRVENGGTAIPVGSANSPEGMSVDAAGNLLVADSGDNVVYKITPAGIQTTFASGLDAPSDVAIDANGNVFVADSGSGNIFQYAPDGTPAAAPFAIGLANPQALTFAPNGDLFVAEQGNNRVSRFDATDPAHTRLDFATDINTAITLTFNSDASALLVGQGGGKYVFVYDRATGARRANFPNTYGNTADMTFDSGGVFYVLDSSRNNITRNTADGRTSTVVATLSSKPLGFALRPPAVAATKADSFPNHGDGEARAGDTIDYKVTITNSGGDVGAKTHIDDPAPANTTDVAGSLRISPIAFDDDYIATKDTPLTVPGPGVLGNDKGIPAVTAVAIASGATANGGTVTLNADGSFTYTPPAGFLDGDSFTYTATNGQSPDDTATVHIQVNAAPTDIAIGNSSVAENEPAGTKVGTFSATDPNQSDAQTFALVSGTGSDDNASFTIDRDGTLVTAASFDYETKNSYAIRVRADDQHGGTFEKQFTVTVTDVNEAPSGTDDSYSTNEDTPLTVAAPGVLSNDTDPEKSTLTASLVSGPAHGTLTFSSDGSFSYTPAANFNGFDSFTYKPNDGTNDGNVTRVNITVNAVDDAPVASADGYATDEDTPLTVAAPGVLANDTDIDGPTLTAVLVTGPSHGTLTLNGDGSFTYTPAANYNGSDSFTYKANDGSLDSNTVGVSITINSVNDAPVAVADSYSTNEDTALTVAAPGVLANDSDADTGDTITAALVSGPVHGTLTFNSNGSFTYTPATNYNGPDSFSYKPNDGHVDGNTVTVSLTINAVNDAPVIDLDSTTAGNDSTVSFTEVLTHDATGAVVLAPNGTISDVDNSNLESLTITLTNHPDADKESLSADTSGTSITAAAYDSTTGVLLLSGTDTVANYQKVLRTVSYNDTAAPPDPTDRKIHFVANDGDANSATATATVTINTLDAPPVVDLNGTLSPGLSSSASFTEDSPPVAIAPNAEITDADTANLASLTVTLTNRPDSGTESLAGDISGTTIIADAYIPSTGVLFFHGSDTVAHYQQVLRTVTYNNTSNTPDTTSRTVAVKANDGQKDSTVANSTVSVTPHDDPPVAHDDSASMLEDASATSIDVLANDTDVDGGSKSIGSVTQPAHGAVVITGGGTGLTYQPTANYCNDGVSNDTFTYTLTPGSSTATVSIAVTCVNDPPTFTTTGNPPTVNEDAGAQAVTGFVTSISAGPSESGQTVSFPITANTNTSLFSAQPTIDSTGKLTYTSALNQNGTATITYHAHDTGGTANGGVDNSGDQTFTITVNAVNDPPVVTAPGPFSAQANMKVTGLTGLLANVTDGDTGVSGCNPVFTVANVSATNPAGGTISNLNASTGSFDFDPPPGVTGAVTFTYTVSDNGCPGTATSAPVTVTVNVSGPVIWFVNPSTASPVTGDGRLSNPFSSLAQATTAMGSNSSQRIFVYSGTTASGTGVTLTGSTSGTLAQAQGAAQWLIGQGAIGTNFDTVFAITPPAGTIARPSINGTRPTIQGTVTMKENTVVRGVNIDVSAGSAKGLTASSLLATGSGSVLTISDVSVTAANGNAVDFNAAQTVNYTTSNASTSPNTITSTTGTALSVVGTTIGSSGMTFRSISSNGASSGIVLNTTGSSGALTVGGNGGGACNTTPNTTNCSGGMIQNSSGPGISLNSVGGGVSLTRMSINNGGSDGIAGSSVNGLSLNSCSVSSNGNALGEHGLDFTGLTGTVSLTSCNVSSNFDSNVFISNASGTLNMTVSGAGSSYSSAQSNDGIHVEGTDTGSQNLTIQGTAQDPIVFANNKDSHVQHTSDSDNTTNSSVIIDHCSMSEVYGSSFPLGGGITVNHGGHAVVRAAITNNNIQNSVIGAIAVDTAGSVALPQFAHIDATISNNTIGTSGLAGSGASQGNGILVSSNGAGQVKTLITGNTIRQWTDRNGIELDADDGSAQLDATVKDNVLTEPNSASAATTTRGMTFQLGAAQTGDNVTVCMDIGDPSNAANKNQVAGTGESPQPDIRWLYEGPSSGGPSVVKLVGYSGPSSPSISDIASYLQPRNNVAGTPTVSGTAMPTGSGSVINVGACAQPASP